MTDWKVKYNNSLIKDIKRVFPKGFCKSVKTIYYTSQYKILLKDLPRNLHLKRLEELYFRVINEKKTPKGYLIEIKELY